MSVREEAVWKLPRELIFSNVAEICKLGLKLPCKRIFVQIERVVMGSVLKDHRRENNFFLNTIVQIQQSEQRTSIYSTIFIHKEAELQKNIFLSLNLKIYEIFYKVKALFVTKMPLKITFVRHPDCCRSGNFWNWGHQTAWKYIINNILAWKYFVFTFMNDKLAKVNFHRNWSKKFLPVPKNFWEPTFQVPVLFATLQRSSAKNSQKDS